MPRWRTSHQARMPSDVAGARRFYVLDRLADVTEVIPRDVLAVVFGPDGSTVMRRDDTGEDAWSALWNGDEAHDVQATGMLSAIVAPLAAGGVPVWVVSGYAGDQVRR